MVQGLRFEYIRFRGKAVGSRIHGTAASPMADVAIQRLDVEATQPALPLLSVRHVTGLTIEDSSLRLSGEPPAGLRNPMLADAAVAAEVLAPAAKAEVAKLTSPPR